MNIIQAHAHVLIIYSNNTHIHGVQFNLFTGYWYLVSPNQLTKANYA